jgi:hypothetical protein
VRKEEKKEQELDSQQHDTFIISTGGELEALAEGQAALSGGGRVARTRVYPAVWTGPRSIRNRAVSSLIPGYLVSRSLKSPQR